MADIIFKLLVIGNSNYCEQMVRFILRYISFELFGTTTLIIELYKSSYKLKRMVNELIIES